MLSITVTQKTEGEIIDFLFAPYIQTQNPFSMTTADSNNSTKPPLPSLDDLKSEYDEPTTSKNVMEGFMAHSVEEDSFLVRWRSPDLTRIEWIKSNQGNNMKNYITAYYSNQLKKIVRVFRARGL
jgi:hypothetical protein